MIFFRNLLRHKTRSIMTLLGASLGIALYVSIQVITVNLLKEIGYAMSEYDTDITVQAKRASGPISSRITAADVAGLQEMFGADASPLVIDSLKEKWNPFALLIGATPASASRFGLVDGRNPAPDKHEVMVGSLLADRLGLRVGGTLSIRDENYSIVGLFRVGSRFLDGAILADLADAQKLVAKEGIANLVLVKVRNKGEIKSVVDRINSRFPRLNASRTSDFVSGIRTFKAVETFARAVAIISFVGSCLVVTNTLLMAVSERTRELGILMAIGWKPILVLRVLYAESLALCLTGAVAGNIIAILILKALNGSRAIGFGWVPVSLPVDTVLYSFGLSILLASVAIIWPAMVIFRLSPAEALRHE